MFGLGIMTKIMDLAGGGVGAFGPLAESIAPNGIQALYMNRMATRLAERSAALARLSSDIVGAAMRSQADVPADHIARMVLLADECRTLAAGLRGGATADDLGAAFAPPPQRAPNVAQIAGKGRGA